MTDRSIVPLTQTRIHRELMPRSETKKQQNSRSIHYYYYFHSIDPLFISRICCCVIEHVKHRTACIRKLRWPNRSVQSHGIFMYLCVRSVRVFKLVIQSHILFRSLLAHTVCVTLYHSVHLILSSPVFFFFCFFYRQNLLGKVKVFSLFSPLDVCFFFLSSTSMVALSVQRIIRCHH